MLARDSLLADARILIVGKHPDDFRMLVEALRAAGCRLNVVFDGVHGYNQAVVKDPDLILMDVHLSNVGGFAVSRQLKANPRTACIPIIFISEVADAADRIAGFSEGGVDFILRPFEVEEVIARIRIHLSLSLNRRRDGEAELAPRRMSMGLKDDTVLVRAATKYLVEHMAEPPGLSELARLMGVGERRLMRAFRRETNGTAYGFLREERMRVAQRLLVETSLSVAVIAAEVGYSSAANFSTAFLKYVRMSPGAFRKCAARVVPRCTQASPVERRA